MNIETQKGLEPALIDVLIPVFNGEKTIRGSITSIQRQTVSNIRIVVVNDGSTDATLAILNELALNDPRLQIISKPNSGIVDALNTGLEFCQSEFIARHDADDLAYPERFAAQIDYLTANPNCIAVSCSARHIDENDHPTGTHVVPRSPKLADPAWIPCKEPYLLHPFLMIRRTNLVAMGGYRECQASEDSDLYWRLQETGELHNMQDMLGDYRMHAQSISSQSIRNGRRMALGSQLGGLSALRRRCGQTDINFDKERTNFHANAETLEEFYRLGSQGLNENELLRLRISMSAKLMELASYRPFELDRQDCQFIRKSFQAGQGLLNEANRIELEARFMRTTIRLVKKGMLREVLLLSSPRLLMKMFCCTMVTKAFRRIGAFMLIKRVKP